MPTPLSVATDPAHRRAHLQGSRKPLSDTGGVTIFGGSSVTLPHPAPPDEMSPRARVYLSAGMFRHITVGLFCILAADQFAAAAFLPIIGFVPLKYWGASMVLTAWTLGFGAFLRHRTIARVGLIMSAGITALLATGLWLGAGFVWFSGGKATPITAIILTALVVKDLAVCTDPMKTPLELSATWRKVARGGES